MMYLPAWRPELSLVPSWRWGMVLATMLALVLGWISRWSLHWGWLAALMCAVLVYGSLLWRTTVSLQSQRAVRHVRLDDDGWYLERRAECLGPLRLARSTWLQPFLVWLAFDSMPGDRRGRYSVLICPDSTDPDSYRRLQAFLRWQTRDVIVPDTRVNGSAAS